MKSTYTESSIHNETAMSASFETFFAHWMLAFQKRYLAEYGYNCGVEKGNDLHKLLRLVALLDFVQSMPEFVKAFDAER